MQNLNLRCRTRRGSGGLVSAIAIFLVAGYAVAAEQVNYVGGNSSSNQLLGLQFDSAPPGVIVLNNDASSRTSLRSFDFFEDLCNARLDVVVADTNRSDLLIYRGGQGTGDLICTAGSQACPARPDGISLSNKREMAVAETGAGGSTPSVWLFTPEAGAQDTGNCPAVGDAYGPFDTPRTTGQIRVCPAQGPCRKIGGILDTEFVSVPGGGFSAGDLLLLTSNPISLARLTADQVEALRSQSPGTVPNRTDADIIVGDDVLGSLNPAGLAFIPGTAGIGSPTDQTSLSEDLLIAGTGGRIVKMEFVSSGGDPTLVDSPPPDFLPVNLGNGPLGIAAGVVRDDHVVVIADRQRGTYLRVGLENVSTTNVPEFAPKDQADWVELAVGVQNPQGAAINTDAISAENCDNDGEDGQTGCLIRNIFELNFTQNVDIDDTLLASIDVVIDPRTSDRDITFAELGIEGNYTVPANCRGLALADDGVKVLVVGDLAKNFAVDPGEFVQVRGLVESILPQVADCNALGTRTYYHELNSNAQPNQGTLYDTTFVCENPPKGGNKDLSPVVICADALFQDVSSGKRKGKVAKRLQAESRDRANDLVSVLQALPDAQLSDVKAALLALVDDALNAIGRKDFELASAAFDAGAELAYCFNRDPADGSDDKAFCLNPEDTVNSLRFEATGVPATAYGDVLTRFLNQGFWNLETGAGISGYCPPDVGLVNVACQNP